MFAVVIFGGIVCVFAILVERLGGNITQVPVNLTNPYSQLANTKKEAY